MNVQLSWRLCWREAERAAEAREESDKNKQGKQSLHHCNKHF